MTYEITDYTYSQAKKLNVVVMPSFNKKKKIDVFDNKGKRLAQIGAIGYLDYPYYIKKYGKEYADKRRKLYKQRHEKDRHIKGSAGYFADKLLW